MKVPWFLYLQEIKQIKHISSDITNYQWSCPCELTCLNFLQGTSLNCSGSPLWFFRLFWHFFLFSCRLLEIPPLKQREPVTVDVIFKVNHPLTFRMHVLCSVPGFSSSFGSPECLRVLLEASQVEFPGLRISVVSHGEASLYAVLPMTCRESQTTPTCHVNVLNTSSSGRYAHCPALKHFIGL